MSRYRYNIVMFAYNEEENIANSISSVYRNSDEGLNYFYLLANGCSDNTVRKANEIKASLQFENMNVVEIELGDKCNAWNKYVHELADNADVHFFIDADVQFSEHCFSKMTSALVAAPDSTMVIAGLPLSGRNVDFYRSLVLERSCFFGNLYGMKRAFVSRIREKPFRLPIGLNWIDSFLTKAVNTDLNFTQHNLPNRTTWIEGVGYNFDKLSLFKRSDIQLYINRIARYELGKIQEHFLDEIPCENWPENMTGINQKIFDNFETLTGHLGYLKKRLVKKRLIKLLKKSKSM